ncbi:HNH endonuclease [Desulfocurvibacter africanus]|uniref:HNH endonuclease n=1 Tax=Desulfocurvibacter africanus subsp. africanus str. Walvis Bay TaxID=690850 RepID=F3YZA2_DESAF|nr:HNH endonuclease signature motif containing protein [Desulfocurvibacter africanus]EGJ50858.1 HNH endonuclease [Desulfocurvibacter africanus subsp. africanus str. Walvis Bay]
MPHTGLDIFLQSTIVGQNSLWKPDNLPTVASTVVPEAILGKRKYALQADIKALWAKWFLEGLCDPLAIARSNEKFAHIYKKIRQSLDSFHHLNPEDQITISIELAKAIEREAIRINKAERRYISTQTKEELLAIKGKDPRCAICGYKFTEMAIDIFLKRKKHTEWQLPLFIDYMTLKGKGLRDLTIEVDHIRPISLGGDNEIENLQLLCGWCNSNKSDRTNFFDVDSSPDTFNHPLLGTISTPKPFWVVRAFATVKQCEFHGCPNTAKTTELYILPKYISGSMNPLNLQIVCGNHDTLKHRLIPNRFVPN